MYVLCYIGIVANNYMLLNSNFATFGCIIYHAICYQCLVLLIGTLNYILFHRMLYKMLDVSCKFTQLITMYNNSKISTFRNTYRNMYSCTNFQLFIFDKQEDSVKKVGAIFLW